MVRTIILSALQDRHQQVLITVWDGDICPVFRARYRNIEYLIPVCKERKKNQNPAPVVRTILLPGMEKHVIGERRGWNWEKF